MNKEQLSQRIGNMDDRLVVQAEHVPSYGRQRRSSLRRKIAGIAAVIVLMACSGAVGALAFSRETVREVPAQQETVELTGIGVTVLLPDSWAGQYEVVQDSFLPYNSAMWEFCAKSVYEDETFYRGSLFTVFQYADYSMSAEEFAQSGLAGIGRYLEVHGGVVGVVTLAGFNCLPPAGKTAVVICSRALQNVPAHGKTALPCNKQGGLFRSWNRGGPPA